MSRQSDIDRGDKPAETISELVSAIRQNLAGAGADANSLKIILTRREVDVEGALEVLERLRAHLLLIDGKATLAREHADDVFDRQWESNKSHVDGTHPLAKARPHTGAPDEMCWCGVVHFREDDDRSAW